MPRMRGAGRPFGYERYHSGPVETNIFVYVDGITGRKRWSRELPTVVRVTSEELELHLRDETFCDEHTVETLCDYEERARSIDEIVSSRLRENDIIGKMANDDETFLAECSLATVQAKVQAWQKTLDSCPRCTGDSCTRCHYLQVRIRNGDMCQSFLNLAARTADRFECAAYVAIANLLVRATHPVRSRRDVDFVNTIDASFHESVGARLDECAKDGEFRFEFEERLGLRPANILNRDQDNIRALYKDGSVFCPDRESAFSTAKQLGVYDLPAPALCFHCSRPTTLLQTNLFDEEVTHQALHHSPYMKSLRHGYWVISLEGIAHEVEFVDDDNHK